MLFLTTFVILGLDTILFSGLFLKLMEIIKEALKKLLLLLVDFILRFVLIEDKTGTC